MKQYDELRIFSVSLWPNHLITMKLLLQHCLPGLIIFCFCITTSAHSQEKTNDSSTNQLTNWLSLATELRFSRPDSARYYCSKVLDLARAAGKTAAEAEALRIISISYEAQGNYRNALTFGLKALELWEKTGEEAKIANTLNSVGIVYDQQGNFYEALRYYNQAYDIYKRLGDDKHLAMMNVNLGILFKSQEQYDQVIRHYKDAYAIYYRLKLPEETAFCEANLGSVFYYTRQYDSCIYYSLKAEKALLAQKNLQFLPVAQANAGLGYLEKGMLPEAEVYLQKALATHRQYGNRKETAFVLVHLGRLYLRQGKGSDAYAALKEAKAIALSIGSPQQVMDASKLLAGLYAQRGDYLKAYNEHVNYSMIKDTLFEQQKTKEITNHQVRYETARKEQEISLLQQKNTIHELNLRQRNLYLFIAAVLLSGTLLATWLIYRNKKLREAQLKKEAELNRQLLQAEAENALQQDRLRISRELHDNIGSQLSFIKSAVDMTTDHAFVQVKDILEDTIRDLRKTVWLINKPAVRLDEWIVKLREYYGRLPKVGILIEKMAGEERVLSSRQATGLFRIIQEAVNNSLKHAEAEETVIAVSAHEQGIRVVIKDNGKGFEKSHTSKGFGLNNMQHHARETGGTVQIESFPGKGTQIIVNIPL